MKIKFDINVTENGKASLNRDNNTLTTFPAKTTTFKGDFEVELTSDEIAMAVASAPSNLGAESARQALATKLMALWAKVAARN